MATELIHDRGRGPELVGTRITVYNLLPHLLDPATTEAQVGERYELSAEQVAAARAYVLNHPDTVLARHLEIEARMAAGNPPEVIEQAQRIHATFMRFKEWSAEQRRIEEEAAATSREAGEQVNPRGRLSDYREWMASQEAGAGQGS